MVRLNKGKDAALIGRLLNWKFNSALALVREDHPETVSAVVKALAETFGNCGWFDGNMATIIQFTVSSLCPEDENAP